MIPFHRITTALVFVLMSALSFGQGSIRGYIKDAASGQPMIFVTVGLEGTSYGTSSDENGYYSITKIPLGTYQLIVQPIGFTPIKEEINIADEKVISKNYFLEKNEGLMQGIEFNAEKEEQRNDVNVSSEKLRPKDIKRIPSIGGAPDLAQALTTLPGFISTGDQGGQIFVRGGSPVQNKVLLDGMIVYNAFHSIGFFSVFDTDVISNAEVFTGGFSAEYGGRISSVIDITTRDGNKKEVKGHVGLNPFGAKIQLEGPLKKLRENGSGISYVLSAKNSYLDQTSKLFYPYVNNGAGLPFRYTDIYGKISTSGASGSKFNAFGFNFSDGVSSYRKLASLNWRNTGYGGNFVVSPSSSSVLISGVFARSDYEIRMKEENNPDRYSKITSFNFGLNFKYNIDKDVLKYGIEVVGFSTDYSTYTLLGYKVAEQQNTTELNAFADYKFNRGRWVIEPSLRFQYYGTLAVLSPEPRIGIKFKQSDRLRFKAAAGKYTQNLMATNSDRDVVNLFYGFLASPENLPGEYTDANYEVQKIQNVLQTAYHVIGGFEFDVTENWNINVEGYYRNFSQLTNVNRNKIFDMADEDKPAELRYDYIIETGQAYGCDFVSKYTTKDIIINMVYSLAKVRRWDGYAYYAPVFDRRHNVNFVGTYIMGKNDEYEFSVRWNLGSGLPFTQTQGFYNGQGVQQGISLDYVSNNSQYLTVQYATLNGGRLPYYHRLDISFKRAFTFKNKSKLDVTVGATNLYNRANVFYIDRVTGQRVDQLPFLPSIGLEFEF